jgi:hypothetical protein
VGESFFILYRFALRRLIETGPAVKESLEFIFTGNVLGLTEDPRKTYYRVTMAEQETNNEGLLYRYRRYKGGL